jgi:hypothetical protein
MAVFRIISLVYLDFHGDLIYDVIPAMIWVDAQVSTAIILTCCPLLRPLFEKVIPKKLTRTGTQWSQKPVSINVRTEIAVHPETSAPRPKGRIAGLMHDEGPVSAVHAER